jgi:superfamily I DNA and/or RNA helicase
MLKRQYRCHPVLGTLASDLFYEGKLINGVTEQDRRALVEGWPPLLFFNSAGAHAFSKVSVLRFGHVKLAFGRAPALSY